MGPPLRRVGVGQDGLVGCCRSQENTQAPVLRPRHPPPRVVRAVPEAWQVGVWAEGAVHSGPAHQRLEVSPPPRSPGTENRMLGSSPHPVSD